MVLFSSQFFCSFFFPPSFFVSKVSLFSLSPSLSLEFLPLLRKREKDFPVLELELLISSFDITSDLTASFLLVIFFFSLSLPLYFFSLFCFQSQFFFLSSFFFVTFFLRSSFLVTYFCHHSRKGLFFFSFFLSSSPFLVTVKDRERKKKTNESRREKDDSLSFSYFSLTCNDLFLDPLLSFVIPFSLSFFLSFSFGTSP